MDNCQLCDKELEKSEEEGIKLCPDCGQLCLQTGLMVLLEHMEDEAKLH